jgi:hypothetical protein
VQEVGIDPASPRDSWPEAKLIRVLQAMQQTGKRNGLATACRPLGRCMVHHARAWLAPTQPLPPANACLAFPPFAALQRTINCCTANYGWAPAAALIGGIASEALRLPSPP